MFLWEQPRRVFSYISARTYAMHSFRLLFLHFAMCFLIPEMLMLL